MIHSLFKRLKEEHIKVFQEQKGQSIIIITFAFLGLIAMMGLALDLGLVYIEQVRISRTTDAAALAAVVELPYEEESMRRAIEYIELNGYDVDIDTEIRVRGCIDMTPFGPDELRNVTNGKALGPNETIVMTPTHTITDSFVYRPAAQDPPRAVFVIDTLAYEPALGGTIKSSQTCAGEVGDAGALYGQANKLRVSGEVQVDMNFMQFFGFGEVPVQDQAVGENVTNLDIAVVFDYSGSQNFETNCFGCWVKDSSKNILDYPYPTNGEPYSVVRADNKNICTGATATVSDAEGFKYLAHEAEYYSADVPLHGWEFKRRTAGQGFWAAQLRGPGSNDAYIRAHPMVVYSQRSLNDFPQLQGASYNSECFTGSKQSGKCWDARAKAIGETAPSRVPYVEYDFVPKWSGKTYVWIRAVGGAGYSFEWWGKSPKEAKGGGKMEEWKNAIYWQIDNSVIDGREYPNLKSYVVGELDEGVGSDADWRWVKLGLGVDTTQNVQSTFRLFQGSAGFNVDKIIFTNNPSGQVADVINNSGGISTSGGSPNDDYKALRDVLKSNSGAGPAATAGSGSREACNVCNPAYALTIATADCTCRERTGSGSKLEAAPGSSLSCSIVPDGGPVNQGKNDLFSDIQPLRASKEAVKNFAARLDPKFDQLGFVVFSTGVPNSPRMKLQCLRYAQYALKQPLGECFDLSADPITYTNVIVEIEKTVNDGSTNIALGMMEGLEELGIDDPLNGANVTHECSKSSGDGKACDRAGAARRILILMTDGSPNLPTSSTDYCKSLPASATWKGSGGSNISYHCAIYYAQQAAKNNVTVYTIGVGAGVNISLLTAMAEGIDPATGDEYIRNAKGKFYLAATPDDLDAIFEDILSNVVVRLVG